jgi:hypothetical protein
MPSRLLLIGAASLTLLGGATVALAGPDVHVIGRTHEGPREAPPPPRDEHVVPRPGMEWVAGRWDWRNHGWVWLPGRWEKEHAGQHWHQGHWDHQGDQYVWTEGAWGAGGPEPMPPPVAANEGPREAPPPPKDEHVVPRPGMEWVAGRWDWRDHAWVWLPGRWEKEHAGQHWHEGHWDHQGDRYVWTEGAWGAGGPEPMPPPASVPPHENIPPHHEWHLDRPTVSSYWPEKGKVGARVVIHGKNFPSDTQVMWGPTTVTAAKVEPEKIVFEVPSGAQSATILLKVGHGHDLVVGNFQVADFDADAEAKRIEAQRVAAAQAAWAASQARFAHDEAAREAALEAEYQQREADRESRRAQRMEEIRHKWQAAFLADPDTQSELTLHAQRVADLARAKDLAGVTANSKLGVRIDVATQRENDRHDQRMAALKTAFEARGGAH